MKSFVASAIAKVELSSHASSIEVSSFKKPSATVKRYVNFAEEGRVGCKSEDPQPVTLSSDEITHFMRPGVEGFGDDDFVANNPPGGVDPRVWRAAVHSKHQPKTPSSRKLDPITRDMILSLGVDPDVFERKEEYEARTNILGDIKAVADVAVAVRDKYRELDAKYPVSMEVARLAAPVILTCGAGLIWMGSRVGATAAARYAVSGIATSHLVNTVAGDEIGSALGKVHETVASGLESVADLNPNQSSALASGIMLGVSVALDVNSGVHAATSYKMQHTRKFCSGHKDDSSVFFKKSADDSSIGLKSDTKLSASEVGVVDVPSYEVSSYKKHVDIEHNFLVTNPVEVVKSRKVTGPTANSYEDAIASLYSGQNAIDNKYFTKLRGKTVTGIADHAFKGIGKKTVAVEAKFVKDWNKSPSNPDGRISHMDFAIKHREFILYQARKYNAHFHEVIYHTNSPEFAKHYDMLFKKNGITNIEFMITPTTTNK